MRLNVYTWDGNAINDGSNYAAWFEVGQPAGIRAQPAYSPRTQTFPKLSTLSIDGTSIVLHIETKGTIHSQLDELKAWFNVLDFERKILICKDAADTDRQWYVKGMPTDPVIVSTDGVGEYIVTIALDEPLWRTVTSSSDSLAVTASGQSKALTILGNHPARPVITLTINSQKVGGYNQKLFKPWYNPLSIPNNEYFDFTNGGINTTNLVSDSTVSNQINQVGGITAAATSIPIDTSVGGGLATSGGMCYVDTEQIYYTSISAGVMTVYDDGAGTTGRGWGGTTAATHADNAVLKKSHCMANGNDVRIFDGDVELDRYFSAFPSSATKIWIRPYYKAGITLQLATAIGAGSLTEISIKDTAANRAALNRLPETFMFVIDNEAFWGMAANANKLQITVTSRGQRGTSAASHAKNATVRWIEHDLILAYGSPLADDPEVDTSVQPIFDMVNSTNTSLVFASFKSTNNLRGTAWTMKINSRTSPEADANSRLYTATQNTLADPASVLGFAIKSWKKGTKLKAEDLVATMNFYHPAGITTVTVSGNKYRSTAEWFVFKFQKSSDAEDWDDVFTEATPSAATTWGALSSHSSVSLSGTYKYLRWLATDSLAAKANNYVALEMTDATLTLNSSNVLQTAFSTTTDNSYYLDTVISCTETGESIRLRGNAKTSSVVVIDTDRQTVKLDGVLGQINITFNTSRNSWLDLPSPKQSATCTLVYTESGVAGVTMAVSWENRAVL